MPDPIHPDHVERIERECAEARARVREGITATLRSFIEFWDSEREIAVARSTVAYDAEQARLHRVMLAAIVADGEVL